MTLSADQLYPVDYAPKRHVWAKLRRRWIQETSVVRLGEVTSSIITFSFDDFPKSAVDNGADILDSIDAKAIYYACSGLAGKSNLTGEQYQDGDVKDLLKAGHEIGAHTHYHIDCSAHPVDTVLADIDRNVALLKQMGVETPVRHFAYPYGETNIALKKALANKFDTARGILPGNNSAKADKMQLKCMELTPDPMTIDRAIDAINMATRTPRWLHIFTHDVRSAPSGYGVTPQSFRRVAQAARDSGLRILTPTKALNSLRAKAA